MKLDVFDWTGKVVSDFEISDEISQTPYREDIIHEIVRWQRAKARAGTQSIKSRSQVSGSTRKIRPQKESGKARQGDGRESHFRGGGAAHGRFPRDYEFKVMKKVKKLGLRSAFAKRLSENRVALLETSEHGASKTKDFVNLLNNLRDVLKVESKKILFVSDNIDDLCIRNLHYIDILPVRGLNVLDMVRHDLILSDINSMQAISDRLVSK